MKDDKSDLVGHLGLAKSIQCPSCSHFIEDMSSQYVTIVRQDCTFTKIWVQEAEDVLNEAVRLPVHRLHLICTCICFKFTLTTQLVMPFPRRYKTKEDKKAANRLKSKRYYVR